MLNNRRILVCIFLSLFYFLLSACTGLSATQTIHLTPQNLVPTDAVINAPANTLTIRTESSIYTITAEPTKAQFLTPRPSIIPTITPQATPTMPLEIALLETQIAGFSASCDDNNLNHASLSSTGNWLVINCEENKNQNLRIYNRAGKKWELPYKDYSDERYLDYGGSLYPVYWTNDDRYLYFRSSMRMSAGGTCFYGGIGQGLYRLDLNNGTVDATLPPLKNGGLYLFSFSPSGRWLVVDKYILDLQTGEKIYLEGREYSFGDFIWSSDSSKLAYSSCLPSSRQFVVNQSAIRIFYLDTRKYKTIFNTKTENIFLHIDSEDGNLLKIFSDDFNNRIEYASFDLSTEKLTELTLTPTP